MAGGVPLVPAGGARLGALLPVLALGPGLGPAYCVLLIVGRLGVAGALVHVTPKSKLLITGPILELTRTDLFKDLRKRQDNEI